jgi:O-antigen/teichoic acid export membrane protein
MSASVPPTPEPAPDPGRAAATVPWRLDHARRSDRRVLARSSLTIAGRVVSKLGVAVFLVLAARLLTKAEYGVYSYVLVLAGAFAIVADPQVTVLAGRDVSSGSRDAATAYWAAFPIVLASGALAGLAMLGFGLFEAGPGASVGALAIAAVWIVFNRLCSLGLDMLRALGRLGTEAAIETAGTLLLVLGAGAVAASGLGVSAVLCVFALHAAGVAVACQIALRGDVRWYVAAPAGYRMALVRSALKLGLAAGAIAIATRGPLIALGIAGSAVAVATLSAGLRFADAAYLLAITAGQALLPSIAALLADDPRRARRLARRAIGGCTAAGVLAVAIAAPFATEIMRAVFGASYASSGSSLAVLMLSVPFMGMLWISWFGLCAHWRERDVLLVAGACAPACVAAAAIAVPQAGALGAAWVYSAAVVALALGTYGAFELRAAEAAG